MMSHIILLAARHKRAHPALTPASKAGTRFTSGESIWVRWAQGARDPIVLAIDWLKEYGVFPIRRNPIRRNYGLGLGLGLAFRRIGFRRIGTEYRIGERET